MLVGNKIWHDICERIIQEENVNANEKSLEVDRRTILSRLFTEASVHDYNAVEATTKLFEKHLRPEEILRFSILAAADEVYPTLDRAWHHLQRAVKRQVRTMKFRLNLPFFCLIFSASNVRLVLIAHSA
jgi:hypothetical protein